MERGTEKETKIVGLWWAEDRSWELKVSHVIGRGQQFEPLPVSSQVAVAESWSRAGTPTLTFGIGLWASQTYLYCQAKWLSLV